MSGGALRALRWLAALLVRGRDAPYVLGDLDEGYRHDRAAGQSRARAAARYLANTVASAATLALRGLRDRGIGASWLDVKLGVRMLRRQPMLTAVSVFALAIAIPVAMVPGQMARAFSVDLPFPDGARIVGIQNWDMETAGPALRSLHHFERWADELKSFESVGAYSQLTLNVISEDGRAAPVDAARFTASVFDVLRVPPALGRRLVPSDERPGAPDVVVLGHDLWQSRLGGDPGVVGRSLRIGGTPHEVVGVMPQGFFFPERQQVWLPLRARVTDHPPGQGPELAVIGRLAAGVSLGRADTEVVTVGRALAAADPEAFGHLRSEAVPFTRLGATVDFEDQVPFLIIQGMALMLLVLACGNVGVLILARTAMRTSEIAVRTALGASRRRIVTQIFVETLVMASVAVAVGLVVSDRVAEAANRMLHGQIPFWLDFGVRPGTVVVALALAVGSAVLAGVIPALRATGGDVQATLQRAGKGTTRLRFGALSTALIVGEVAVSVWFLTMTAPLLPEALGAFGDGMEIDPDEWLVAQLHLPPPATADGAPDPGHTPAARMATAQSEIRRRLAAEPGVGGVALGMSMPGHRTPGVWIEVEGHPRTDGVPGYYVRSATILSGFFEAFGQPVLAGRGLSPADASAPEGQAPPVVVNETFADQVLGGRNAVGQRIRTTERGGTDPGPWMEVVGVVPRLGLYVADARNDAGFYRMADSTELNPVQLAVRTPGSPADFAARLRAIAAEADPTLLVGNPRPMAQVVSEHRADARWATLLLGVIALVAVVLSAAGLYALVSFTVSMRTREIGIRTALGASRPRIASGVAARASAQLGGGVVLGAILGLWIAPDMYSGPAMADVDWTVLVGSTTAATLAVGLLACFPPLLRSLRISPMEALAEE